MVDENMKSRTRGAYYFYRMIHIIHQYSPLPCPKAALIKAAKSVYRQEGVGIGQSTVIIMCSDYVIRKLNRQYRRKDKATDVLSFCFGDCDLLGEVYISLQRVKVQARRYGVSYESELKRLLVHGLLHLVGYDHIKRADRAVMEAREKIHCGEK
jgi:probable rRNA maturation factor